MKHIKTYRIFENRSIKTLTPSQIAFLDRGCSSPGHRKATWEFSPEEGSVNVYGVFDCSKMGLTELPAIPWGHVDDFFCGGNPLTSLENSPPIVRRSFLCYRTNITSLEGGPSRVGEIFDCSINPRLVSFNGLPQCLGFIYDNISLNLSVDGYNKNPLSREEAFNCFAELLLNPQGGTRDQLSPDTTTRPLTSKEIILIVSYLIDNCKDRSWMEKAMGETFLKLYTGHEDYQMDPEDWERVQKLVLPFMDESFIDKYFKENPLDMDLLDAFPDIKAGMLRRTGLEDISDLARVMRRGLI